MLDNLFAALGCITCLFLCTSSFCYVNSCIDFKATISSLRWNLFDKRKQVTEEEYAHNDKYLFIDSDDTDSEELVKPLVDNTNNGLLFPPGFIPPTGVFTLTDEQMEDMNPDSGLYADLYNDTTTEREVCE